MIGQVFLSTEKPLDEASLVRFIGGCQGPWNVDLRTPPGPEGSNGSLLLIRRGHPGFSFLNSFFLPCFQISETHAPETMSRRKATLSSFVVKQDELGRHCPGTGRFRRPIPKPI